MPETSNTISNQDTALSNTEWEIILEALPDALSIKDPKELKPHFSVQRVSEETVLPASGMYVVLEGRVSLQQKEDVLATANKGDYFYEEHLEISGLPVSLTALADAGTKLAFLSSAEWFSLPAETRSVFFATLFGDLVSVHMQNFQQSINCCSVTAAALSMSALGFSCEVNDIFRKVNLPSSYVVNSGISLGELFDIACTYIHNSGLRNDVQVQTYFMDPDTTSERHLLNAIMESGHVGGDNDILVANFQVGIAHGIPTMPGGHFAIIAKCNPSTGLLHMMDVHPEKYGKMWVTTTGRLYAAMSDRDSGSMRSRGLLRFSARSAVSTELQTLKQDCHYVDSTIHLNISNEKRHEMFRRATPNLNGLSVLAESFEIFGETRASEDKLLQATNVSYTESLGTVRSAEELSEIAQQYLAKGTELHLQAEFRCFNDRPEDGDATAEDWFRQQLESLNQHKKRHLMINIDLNAVLGHEAIARPDSVYRETALLQEFWCLCIAYDEATDYVTIVDMSPATSQVWQAPRGHLFRGLREKENPAMVVLQEQDSLLDPGDIPRLIRENTLALFYSEGGPWSYMLRTVLSNIGIGEEDIFEQDISGHDSLASRMRRQLTSITGEHEGPYLFLNGEFVGKRADVVDMILKGGLQERIRAANLHVLWLGETPALQINLFGYPKGGLDKQPDGKRNVLLCACGSSAADKVPLMVEKLVGAGHNVKLVPSNRAEHFFKDFGSEQILQHLTHSDFYRDNDEWNFRYLSKEMKVRASHLALCDWADCVIVAPVTCNTMGKIANGIGDSLMTSLFVAWQYQTKPVILCPACNSDMWHNITTQNNVAQLKRLGATFVGPSWGTLSNGRRGIGMMASPEDILAALDVAFDDLEHQDHRVIKWAKETTTSDDTRLWKRIFRTINEDSVGVNIVDHETGDSLLHYAAGGAGEASEWGVEKGIPDVKAAKELIDLGINVNLKNDFDFTAMHVAIKNQAEDVIRLLLNNEHFEDRSCLSLLNEVELSQEITDMLIDWSKKFNVDAPDDPSAEDDKFEENDGMTYLYFTYGSLKQGFPNHKKHKDVLKDFVGVARTRQAMPLIVQKEPACKNPNCAYLHRMATLVDRRGDGLHVLGEAYRVDAEGLEKLDELEGYHGRGATDNTYIRKKISILVNGAIETAYVYVIADPKGYDESLKRGDSEIISEYMIDMAKGPLKPGWPKDTTVE